MERIARYILIAVFLIAAVACSFSLPRRDLRATGQVAGIALDEKGGKLRATFELYDPGVDQPIGRSCEIVSSEGEDMEECIKNASRSTGKELYLEDAAVLIINWDDAELLINKMLDFYRTFKNEQMDLPVFFVKEQQAKDVFSSKGKILSTQIAKSAELLKKRHTVRDFMNGEGTCVWLKGEGSYEIIS